MPFEHTAIDIERLQWRSAHPNGDGHPARASEHPVHSLCRSQPVGQKLKPLLAQHHIERRVADGKFISGGLNGLDRWVSSTRHCQHGRAHIGCDDSASIAYPVGSRRCHNTGARRHVQNLLPGAHTCEIDQGVSPRLEDGGDQKALVGVRNGHLIKQRICHGKDGTAPRVPAIGLVRAPAAARDRFWPLALLGHAPARVKTTDTSCPDQMEDIRARVAQVPRVNRGAFPAGQECRSRL